MKSPKQIWFNLLGKGMVGLARFASLTWPVAGAIFPTRLEFDENESVWMKSAAPYSPSPRLEKNIEVDLAIIGGGFTGISTAYHFSSRYPEKRVAVLEAKVLANGSSGRATGMMLNFLTDQFAYGEEDLVSVYQATSSTVHEIGEIIKSHNLKVSHRTDGTLSFLTAPDRAEAAEKECLDLNKLGIPIRYIPKSELHKGINVAGVYGAQFDPNTGLLNGVEYLREMKRVLIERGVQFYENTPVTSVQEGSTITLKTAQAEVKAKSLMLASGSYTGNLGYFKDIFFPQYSHAFATDPLSPGERKVLDWQSYAGFSDDYDMISFSSMTPQGNVLFGGGHPKAYSYLFGGRTNLSNAKERFPEAYVEIRKNFLNYLPQAKDFPIRYHWGGLLDMTLKRNMLIGVRGENRNVFYSLGYCGHGIVTSNLAGKVITDMYSGDDEKWRHLPFYKNRDFAPLPPEPFRSIGYHLFKKLSGKSPRV